MTYSEAVEILRYMQKYRDVITEPNLTQCLHLTQYDFPLSQKFLVIDRVVLAARTERRQIYSLRYFREEFAKEESWFYKGTPPKRGDLAKVSDILGVRL